MNTTITAGATRGAATSSKHTKRLSTWIGRGLAGLLVLLLALAASGALYERIAEQRDRQAFPAPGQLVDVGGYKLHIHCMGEGSPTVILDHMGDGSSAEWAWVQPAVARRTRACAYDRAGFGWSDTGPGSRDARQNVRELHTLLRNAGITGPYVLVGHSYGGQVVRVYTAQYPDEVVGLVLVDPGHPDQRSPRFPAAGRARDASDERLMAYAPLLARLGIWRLIGLLGDPAPDLPLPQREQYKADWSTTKHWDALQAQNNSIPLTDAAARNAGSLGHRPTIVLSASTAYVKQGAPADEARRVWNELHAELAALSTNSLHRVVEGTTHASLTFNREHAHETSAAILQVVEAARTGQPLHQDSDE